MQMQPHRFKLGGWVHKKIKSKNKLAFFFHEGLTIHQTFVQVKLYKTAYQRLHKQLT